MELLGAIGGFLVFFGFVSVVLAIVMIVFTIRYLVKVPNSLDLISQSLVQRNAEIKK